MANRRAFGWFLLCGTLAIGCGSTNSGQLADAATGNDAAGDAAATADGARDGSINSSDVAVDRSADATAIDTANPTDTRVDGVATDVSARETSAIDSVATDVTADRVIDRPVDAYVPDLRDQLVAYWTFEEGQGTTAGDLSGMGNIGTLTNGASWAMGGFSRAQFTTKFSLQTDGVDDFVSVDEKTMPKFAAKKSVSFWFKPGAVPTMTSKQTLIALVNKSTGAQILIGIHDGRLGVFSKVGTTVTELIADKADVDATHWYLIGYNFDGAKHGFSTGSVFDLSATATLDAGDTEIVIGAGAGGQDPFQGQIDDVRAYGRPLNDIEMLILNSGL